MRVSLLVTLWGGCEGCANKHKVLRTQEALFKYELSFLQSMGLTSPWGAEGLA